MSSDINTGILRDKIDQASQQATFRDVYRNQVDSSTIGQLYKVNQRFPITSADSINIPEPYLTGLVSELNASLGIYKSSDSGLIGNGLYHLKGSSASPRLPSIEDYAKILALAASRIGSVRVTELLAEWLQGKGLRAYSCVLLKGIETEGKLAPINGIRLDTLPSNGNDFPKSLRIDTYDIDHEQFSHRAMLSIVYETASPLYDPQFPPESFPMTPPDRKLVNPDLSSVSFESFCRAMSLTVNNHVDWFIQWEDYGDVEAFFLNPGFSSGRKETVNSSPVIVSEEDLKKCLEIHSQLHGFSGLDLAIARWRRSKRPTTTYDQLIEIRIALEAVLLNDDKGVIGEKRHRLAIRGAWFLGETFDKRKEYFKILRKVYDIASNVIHAGKPEEKNEHELSNIISDAQNLCRDAILQIARARKAPDWTDVILDRGSVF